MKRLITFVLLMLPLGHLSAAGMQQVADFYVGKVPVDSRTEAVRRQGVRNALSQVLTRATGDVSITLNPQTQPILQGAERYVRNFRYSVESRALSAREAAELPQGAAPAPVEQTFLSVSFDAAALTQAIKSYGLPIWSATRPITLLWIAASTPEQPRALLSEAEARELMPGLFEAAQLRGLPLMFPLLDAQEQAQLSYSDVVGEFVAPIQQASERYQPRHTVLLKLSQQGLSWFARWSLIDADQSMQRWNSFGEDVNAAMRSGIEQLGDQLAQRYVVKVASGWEQVIKLRVKSLASLQDYARVERYLQEINLVNKVEVSALDADGVVYSLRFDGAVDDLQRAIALGSMLREAERELTYSPLGESDGQGFGMESAQPGGLSFFAVSQQLELVYELQ